eukprot:15380-Heterococcus_DN1.PRE.3
MSFCETYTWHCTAQCKVLSYLEFAEALLTCDSTERLRDVPQQHICDIGYAHCAYVQGAFSSSSAINQRCYC